MKNNEDKGPKPSFFSAEFKGKEYLEQWERIERWYKKVMQVKHGFLKEYSQKELLDIIYVYFMNIQHMFDWVKNSTEGYGIKMNKLREGHCFSICADFINNHKHLKRDKANKWIKDKSAAITSQSVKVTVSLPHLNTSASEKIESDVEDDTEKKFSRGALSTWHITHCDKKYDAYDIAKQCFDGWEKFLKNNKLL